MQISRKVNFVCSSSTYFFVERKTSLEKYDNSEEVFGLLQSQSGRDCAPFHNCWRKSGLLALKLISTGFWEARANILDRFKDDVKTEGAQIWWGRKRSSKMLLVALANLNEMGNKVLPRPPYSPYLAPGDYFLLTYLTRSSTNLLNWNISNFWKKLIRSVWSLKGATLRN